MIIDFHTHIFPDKIAGRVIKILESSIDDERVAGKAVIQATADALKKSMNENGIDFSIVLPIATTTEQYKSINKFAAQVNGKDGLFSFGSLHPFQENWESVLCDIKEKRLRGIKLHPEYQKFFIDSPQSLRVLKKCEELDLLTVIHAGCDISFPPPVHCPPERLRRVLDYVKGDKIIAAHLGGWDAWDEVEKYLVKTPMYFDTAYTVDFIDADLFMRIIRNHGSEKILYGTDSPWENQRRAAEYINKLPLTEEEKNNIFFKNAKKLLKIG